ncbi:MAG: hypothetical protein ACE3L7_28170 [Candidatus Pristimantibacillus sp.]
MKLTYTTGDLAEWRKLFSVQITPLANNTPNSEYVEDALAALSQIKPQLSPALSQLLQLNAYLFVLEHLIQQAGTQINNSVYFRGYHTVNAAEDMVQVMKTMLNLPFALADEPENWGFITDTLTYLRQNMLLEKGHTKYFSTIYQLFWMNWLHPQLLDNQAMYLEELQQLATAEAELGNSLSRLPWMLAQCWMYFYLVQDQKAWTLLRGMNGSIPIHYNELFQFLRMLYKSEEWLRLKGWLIEVAPLLNNNRGNILNEYKLFWDAVIVQLPDAEQPMLATLMDMLPYSRHIYGETLLAYGKYQLWMDYQLSIGNEPLEFRVTVFKPLEKDAPEVLLPFYHQAVERYVLLKNRPSYKSAVKLLKRLAKLYKKMKQEARWEQFLTAFAERHSRLRALQEELRKGKLLS